MQELCTILGYSTDRKHRPEFRTATDTLPGLFKICRHSGGNAPGAHRHLPRTDHPNWRQEAFATPTERSGRLVPKSFRKCIGEDKCQTIFHRSQADKQAPGRMARKRSRKFRALTLAFNCRKAPKHSEKTGKTDRSEALHTPLHRTRQT